MRPKPIILQCPCGKEFETYQSLVDIGRGKFCSKSCMYVYRKEAVRTKYTKHKVNKGWFKKGVNSHPDTKIKKGERISVKTEFKKGILPLNYKGDEVGYGALHHWVRYHKGRACKCEKCGSENSVNWANKSHEYKRDLDDWVELCQKCHMKYDRENGWGKASKKFNMNNK